MSALTKRQAAVTATKLKFGATPHRWNKGATCLHLVHYHLMQMGHDVEELPHIRSLLGAKRALKERGWNNMVDVLDAQPVVDRIPPAFATLGDIAIAPSEDGIGAGLIYAGPSDDGLSSFLGWHDLGGDAPLQVIKFSLGECMGVWRV